MARKTPKRSRIETRSTEPRTTERMSVRYSGASPVSPDQRAAARTAKNAEAPTMILKYSAKLSTTNPSPKKLPENQVHEPGRDQLRQERDEGLSRQCH